MEILASTLASLAGPQTAVWIAHDDASHPGCPKCRAQFFGTLLPEPVPEPEPEPEPQQSAELASTAGWRWLGNHVGGVLQRHGFEVRLLNLVGEVAEEWREQTVHVFELRLRTPEEDGTRC